MNTQYGGYVDHIRIGHAGDALEIIAQILGKKSNIDQDTKKALEAIKDAIEKGVL